MLQLSLRRRGSYAEVERRSSSIRLLPALRNWKNLDANAIASGRIERWSVAGAEHIAAHYADGGVIFESDFGGGHVEFSSP
jgi:hypothetical protein